MYRVGFAVFKAMDMPKESWKKEEKKETKGFEKATECETKLSWGLWRITDEERWGG